MRFEENYKKYKSNRFIYLIYLFIFSLMLSGATVSRYVINSNISDSARVAYFGELYITDGKNPYEEENINIVPGMEYEKNATVNFDGSEVESCVFLKINYPEWVYDNVNRSFLYMCNDKEMVFWNICKEWNYLKKDETGNIFYIFIPPNTKFCQSIIYDNVMKVPSEITNSDIQAVPEGVNLQFEVFVTQVNDSETDYSSDNISQQRACSTWNILNGLN